MAEPSTRLANLLRRYASPLSGLRRIPVLGDLLSGASRKHVPGASLAKFSAFGYRCRNLGENHVLTLPQ